MNKVLKAKCYPQEGLLSAVAKSHSSWLWKSWIGAKKILQKGPRYQVGNEKSIKFWESPWIYTTSDFRPETRRPESCNIKWVSKLMQKDGRGWNIELINRIFNKRNTGKKNKRNEDAIVQMPINKLGVKDKLIWLHMKSGNYLVDSAYNWLAKQKSQSGQKPKSRHSKEQERTMWKRLWGMKIKGKIKHFLWHAYPTCDQLKQKGMQVDEICKVYGKDKETIEHMFFH